MSAAEKLVPSAPDPVAVELPSEVQLARSEDPTFPELQARAIAKARGETYSKERHGPHAPKQSPRRERAEADKCISSMEDELRDLLERFRARSAGSRPLKLVPNAERAGVERVRDL